MRRVFSGKPTVRKLDYNLLFAKESLQLLNYHTWIFHQGDTNIVYAFMR